MFRAWRITTLLCFLVLDSAAAETVRHGGVVLRLDAQSSSIIVTEPAAAVSHAQVSTLGEPSRIVIDLPHERGKSASFALTERGIFSGVRFGAHPEMLRVVIDLGDQQAVPAVSLTRGKSGLNIRVAPSAEQLHQAGAVVERPHLHAVKRRMSAVAQSAKPPSPKAPQPVPSALPRAEVVEAPHFNKATRLVPHASVAPVPTALPPQTRPLETPLASPLPSASATAVDTPRSIRQGGAVTLKGVSFDYVGVERTPVVKIVLSKAREFTVLKRDQTSYVLTISSCGVDSDSFLLPQFPPSDFIGFSMLKPELSDSGLEIVIAVDYGTKLATVARENEIWIKSLTQ